MKYSFINSARGIAILMVIIVHTSQLYHFKNIFVKLLFDYGQMGVQLFFIASAYTLCLSAEKRRYEKSAIKNFYIRRFFRIFPVYYLGIILYFVLNLYFKEVSNYTPKNILSNIFFIHGAVPSANNTIVPGGWSIGVEMLFYLIFPVLHKFFFLGHFILKYLFLTSICYLIIFLVHVHIKNNSFWYFNIIVQLPVFMTGILYYKFQKKINLSLATIIFSTFTLASFYFWLKEYFVIIPLLSAISFCGLIKILEKTLLDFRILQRIGVVSYSIYITHFILVFYLLHTTSNFSLMIFYFVITVALCYPFALLLEKYIEKPFIKLGNKIIITIEK